MDKNIDTQATHACVSASKAAAQAPTPAERTMPEKFLYIMQLAMQLNNTPTRKDETGDKPTVFIEFSGHIAEAQVIVYLEGYQYQDNQVIMCHYGMDGSCRSGEHPGKYPFTTEEMVAYLEAQVAKWCNA